jgi:GTP-binding protein YchF
VVHVDGRVDPIRDKEVVETELMLADLDTVEKRLSVLEKKAKSGDPRSSQEAAFLQRLKGMLSASRSLRGGSYSPEEAQWLGEYHLLTDKPVVYVANVSEADLRLGAETEPVRRVREMAMKEGADVAVISGKVEAEVSALPKEERAAYLEAMGLKESGLDRLARAAYHLLDLITFFTAGENEARAWTIHRGMKAANAAGRIHSDMERGFIRAEVIGYEDLMAAGSPQAVRERGQLRIEGAEYIVQDGDILYFRFNV